MNAKQLVMLLAIVAVANAASTFVWCRGDGTVVNTGVELPINVTKVATGHYCLHGNNTNGVFNYGAIVATLQTDGAAVPLPGFAIANSGWGDQCNPYGGYAIYTYDARGAAADRTFSAIISWN